MIYKYNKIIDKNLLFAIIAVLFTGMDLFSVHIAGGVLKMYFILFLFLSIGMLKNSVYKVFNSSFIFLLFSSIPSLIFSTGLLRSITWVINLFISYYLVYNYSNLIVRKVNIQKLMIYIGRIQIYVGLILFTLGIQKRVHLLYYESSYFVMALTPYLSVVLINLKKNKMNSLYDLFMIFMLLIITKSGNLIFILFVFYIILFFRFSLKALLLMISLIVIITALILMNRYNVENRNFYFINHAIFDNNSIFEFFILLFERTGNRIPRIELAWQVFMEHPWVGIGLGNFQYASLFTTGTFSYINNPYGLPACNIFLEAAAEGGVLFMSALIYFFYDFVKDYKRNKLLHVDLYAMQIALIVMITSLLFESSILRGYLWGLLGCIAGLKHMQKDAVDRGGRISDAPTN